MRRGGDAGGVLAPRDDRGADGVDAPARAEARQAGLHRVDTGAAPKAGARRPGAARPPARKHGKPVCSAWIPERLEGPGAAAADSAPELPLFRSTRRMMN